MAWPRLRSSAASIVDVVIAEAAHRSAPDLGRGIDGAGRRCTPFSSHHAMASVRPSVPPEGDAPRCPVPGVEFSITLQPWKRPLRWPAPAEAAGVAISVTAKAGSLSSQSNVVAVISAHPARRHGRPEGARFSASLKEHLRAAHEARAVRPQGRQRADRSGRSASHRRGADSIGQRMLDHPLAGRATGRRMQPGQRAHSVKARPLQAEPAFGPDTQQGPARPVCSAAAREAGAPADRPVNAFDWL